MFEFIYIKTKQVHSKSVDSNHDPVSVLWGVLLWYFHIHISCTAFHNLHHVFYFWTFRKTVFAVCLQVYSLF